MTEVQAAIEGVTGFKVAGVACGLKANGALDFALIASDRPCVAAGIFTTNLVKAAPVLVNMELLKRNNDHLRAVAVNTRCANACTGDQGIANAKQMAQVTADALSVGADEVIVMSTGVIGTQLPMDKIAQGIHAAADSLGDHWDAAARGIMTTDTRPKLAFVTVTTPQGDYHVAGIAKGAGMIAPNMATMLGFIVTDAMIVPEQAHALLKDAADSSFNRIVVDGDMSTNDSVFLLANGASGVTLQTEDELMGFSTALSAVCRKLAQDIVRDAEGGTKFITISVLGTRTDEEALQIANAVATSPLVKTAFYGNDANWGRIVAAVGRSGVAVDPLRIKLSIAPGEEAFGGENALLLFDRGIPTNYDEAAATAIVSQPEVSVILNCNDVDFRGDGAAIVWTCDLSHDYVSINGDYRS